MSHDKLLIIKGLIICSALISYKVALYKAFKDKFKKDKEEK